MDVFFLVVAPAAFFLAGVVSGVLYCRKSGTGVSLEMEGGWMEGAEGDVPLAGGMGGLVGGIVLLLGVLGGGGGDLIISCLIWAERKG